MTEEAPGRTLVRPPAAPDTAPPLPDEPRPRATHWEFTDTADRGTVHVCTCRFARINGHTLVQIHNTEPITVLAGHETATILSLVVHADDLGWATFASGFVGPDTIAGVPVYAPIDPDQAWTPIGTEPIARRRPLDDRGLSSEPTGDVDDRWVRVWVQADAVEFTHHTKASS